MAAAAAANAWPNGQTVGRTNKNAESASPGPFVRPSDARSVPQSVAAEAAAVYSPNGKLSPGSEEVG